MCMPYLGKLFSGDRRRRGSGTGTPRASLAPTPQQSNVTIQTTNVNLTAMKKESLTPVKSKLTNASRETTLAENSSSAAAPTGSSQSSNQATVGQTAGPQKPTSWWHYLGMNRNKKGSIDSL